VNVYDVRDLTNLVCKFFRRSRRLEERKKWDTPHPARGSAPGPSRDKLAQRVAGAASRLRIGNGLQAGVELGPVVSASARERIVAAITHGIEEGAEAVLDGRTVQVLEYPRGYFVGPTILDQIQPEMRVYKEEIFGPVIGMSPVSSLDRVGV
jgi:malonate-semialdehyde dehydrogenase (acetylating) / methylmalonate-semialdehyde dehydrogenase